SFRLSLLLRVDELEFIPMSKDHWSIRFRAHTNPIQPRGRWLGAICLDGYLEALSVQRIDQGLVELEQRFTSRANDEASARRVPIGPVCGNRPRQGMRGIELPAAFTVSANEVRIAERADCLRSVLLHSRPQVAPRKPTENGRPPCLGPFALKR